MQMTAFEKIGNQLCNKDRLLIGEWAWEEFKEKRAKRLLDSLNENKKYFESVSKDSNHWRYAQLAYETSLKDWRDILIVPRKQFAFSVFLEIAIACLGKQAVQKRLKELIWLPVCREEDYAKK